MAWSALVSVAVYAGVVNFEKFAQRPTLPQGWGDARAAEAAELAKKIDAEPDSPEKQQDMQRYFWLLLESRQRQQAHDTVAAIQPSRPAPGGYDAAYEQQLLRLAVGELMHDCSDDMLTTLEHLHDYDKQHLAANDLRLVRDYNNLGLACYLVGQNSDDSAFRQSHLRQARAWLEKAENGFPASAVVDILSVKENQLMLAESLGDQQWANSLHQEIDSLIAQIRGPAPQVTL